jgi:hypothetical protein
MCDFCKTREAVGVYSTHMPMSLAYCQECLDVNEIRTRHNVHMNWIRMGDEYLNNDFTVWFNDKYMSIKDYINELKLSDVLDYYPVGHFAGEALKEKILNLK